MAAPKKQLLQLTAYEYIKNKITMCEYAPNQILSESAIQEELGFSRTPVRDAISRLAQEGLLKVIPKCGIVVTDLTFSDIRMIFEVRALIEPYALRNYGVKLDTDEIVRFAKIFRDNLNRPLDWKMYQLDDQFHSMLISTLPNVYLHDVYSRIQTQNTRLRVMSVQHEIGRSIETCEEHLQITDACLAQDWEAAAQAMTHHLQRSKESSFEAILHGNIQTKFV